MEVEGGIGYIDVAAILAAALEPSLGRDAVLVEPDKKRRRNVTRAVVNCSGLLKTRERFIIESATEASCDKNTPDGPKRTGRTDSNLKRVHSATMQAYGSHTCLS